MLPVTPTLIERAAARLSAGGWRYTPRQLYYATCAELETGPPRGAATGVVGLGALLVVVALILIRFRGVFIALLALGIAVMVLGVVQRLRPPATMYGRVLALSFADFEERVRDLSLSEMLRDEPAKLIARADINKWHNVICDTPETAKLINANLPAAHVDWTFASTLHPQLSPAGGFLSVIALHDASPRGCALPLELADTGVAVIDAGLRPRWVDGTDQQIIEGAPARMPRDLSSVLEEDEITWLAAGQRVELASLPPAQLMQLVKAAVAAAAAPTEGVHALALSHEEIAQITAPHARGGTGSAPARGAAAPGRGAFPSLS